MTFVEPVFVGFLALVLAGCLVVRPLRAQNVLLLVASCVFYGWRHPWYLALLLVSAGVDYTAALGIERWRAHRRLFLALSLTVNLGLLGWFKYHDFVASNVAAVASAAGHPLSWTPLDVLLPVGISFYTFQTIAYTVDVYRGQLRACRSPVDYFLFVTFFPQLVAGPVERAGHLLPQVQAPRTMRWTAFRDGVVLAAWGAFKKLAVADAIAPYVDRVFAHDHASGVLALAGGLAFAVQILADFSGYTDIARGVAGMLGFQLMDNFARPYLAASPSELWRRWHISFSSWIRDYVYIPLGGSRGSWARVTAVTFVAMGTSGLWHGASWNYVIWGGWHALLLVLWRPLRLPRALGVPLMFTGTVVGWVIFRQHDLARLLWSVRHPLPASADEWLVARVVAALALLCATPQLLALAVERGLPRLPAAWLPAARAGFVSSVACALFFLARDRAVDFIYFRF